MKETNFKQSSVGLIPHDWKVVPLHCHADSFIGLTYSPNDVKEFGTLVLRSSNIQNGVLDISDSVFVGCPIPERARTQDGDILVCVRNGSAQLVGKSAMITNAMNMAFGAFMTVLRAKSGISNLYLHYFWKSRTLQIQINDNKGNIINQITQANIRGYKLLLPPTLSEQERIANALSDVDKLIATTEALLQKKRDIKQGTMQQFLSGKRRLPGYSATWEKTPLYRIGEIQMCKRIFSFQTSEFGEIPFFKIGTLGKEPDAFISRTLFENYRNKYNYPIKGEILISAAGTIGRTIKYEGQDCYYQDSNIVWLRNNETIVSNSFLSHAFKVIKWQSQDGGTISRLYNANFRATTCYHPSDITEQQAIVEVLTDMDNEIEALKNSLTKYMAIREAMMQQLLTGKIRLI